MSKKIKGRKRHPEDYWFANPDVFWIPVDQQRSVILNPGEKEELTKVVTADKGEIVLHRTNYIPDLPRGVQGKIIAVTATQRKDKQGNAIGPLKPKPIGTFYELFAAGGNGHRIWVNPSEYQNEDNRKTRRKNRKIQNTWKKSTSRIGDVAPNLKRKGK